MHLLESVHAVRSQVAHELNQFVRRLRQYRTEAEWVSYVLDGAAEFVPYVAVFSLRNNTLHLRGRQGFDFPEGLSFPLESAAAFGSAVETKDPVVALRSPGEVGPSLSTQNQADRAHIIPFTNGSRVVAFIFAAGVDHDTLNALELIAGIGSLVLERQSNTALHMHIASGDIEMLGGAGPRPAPGAPPGPLTFSTQRLPSPLPAWADLDEGQRSLHVRAQRFSRVTIAELQLSRPEACRAGRDQANLYVFLKGEIDKARDTYRKQFMTIPSMVDYLHMEFVRTAAEGDELKLGADYPGQLV